MLSNSTDYRFSAGSYLTPCPILNVIFSRDSPELTIHWEMRLLQGSVQIRRNKNLETHFYNCLRFMIVSIAFVKAMHQN